ncbi:MAG TPA: ABC transporter ATP-binding protein [Gemmatimonadales bacterium]|nr:ABC transporter ATP-binding protein [Gemmatimonadales bacterium]
MAPFLELDGLTKRFDGTTAAEDVSLALERGGILALLGPSGSGKTTTLRMLAGFERPDAGRVRVDGEDVTPLAPERRRFGMVFQHYALFPHLDVGANIAFGLEALGWSRDDTERRVRESLAQVDLAGMERRRIAQLSGGQQQRVALARALAPEPRVLLLDEPLSNLDPALRERTRDELRNVIRRVGITTVLVTHEQEEAFDLADRVAVLRLGRVQQVDTPDALYAAPATPFVARFVGRSSSMTVNVIGEQGDRVEVRLENTTWDLRRDEVAAEVTPGPALLLARPEALWLTAPGGRSLAGTVADRRFLGASALFTVRTAGGALLEVSAPPHAVEVGATVGILPSRRSGGGIHLFPPEAEQ